MIFYEMPTPIFTENRFDITYKLYPEILYEMPNDIFWEK